MWYNHCMKIKNADEELHKCTHPLDKIITDFSGGYYFSQGEVSDDIQENLVCTQCGKTISEKEFLKIRKR